MFTWEKIITYYCLLSPLISTAVYSDCGPFALNKDLLKLQTEVDALKTSYAVASVLPSRPSSKDITAFNSAIDVLKSQVAGVAASIAAISPPAQVAGKMPQSCSDLKSMGYLLNGFYYLQNQTNGHIQTTFCDFTKAGSSYDTVIGINDVKSTNVYFFARLTNPFKVAKAGVHQPIKFDAIATNVGGAFDGTKFIAPVDGVYQFIFHAFAKLVISGTSITIDNRVSTFLQINGNNNTGSFAYDLVDPKKIVTQTTVINTNGGFHQIVALNKSDTVTLTTNYDLYSTSICLVQFTGSLLDEILF